MMSTDRRPGRPPGTPQPGAYGVGVKTKVIRVPETLADKIPEWIVDLPDFCERWRDRIPPNPSPRWDYALRILDELESIIRE